ncbi:MAG: hypothetical protein H6623_07115 [Bdellovibrionaceae bacterium]|nr:hypothetical protein [Pseudobdellovibrionaceae bacterium]
MNLGKWGLVVTLYFFMLGRAQAQETVYSSENIHAAIQCIHNLTLKIYGKGKVAVNPNIPPPTLIVDVDADLTEFQNLAEAQIGLKPDTIFNIYIPAVNRIYLNSSYKSAETGRSAYDTLAHELTHFFQVKYDGSSIADFTDAEEQEAISIQTQFREMYGANIKNGKFECPQ